MALAVLVSSGRLVVLLVSVTAPKGMTYFEFMSDRIDAAKTVKPSQCGRGMILSLAALGPIYSAVYSEVGIHPDGILVRGTAPDPDIPKGGCRRSAV